MCHKTALPPLTLLVDHARPDLALASEEGWVGCPS